MKKWFSLDGTTCVVAGAGGQIGKACSQALVDSGAAVVGLDVSFRGGSETERAVDVTDEAALKKFFSELAARPKSAGERWAFINCSYPRTANWGQLGFENTTTEDWNRNVELHLGSAFTFTREAVEFMKSRGGGSLVNFGSIYGVVGPDFSIYEGTKMTNAVAYAGIKGGIIALTRYVATAFGRHNIRANVVCPGGIKGGQAESFVKAYEKKTALGRMAVSDDIAGVIAFLVGPSAEYITGQTLLVDGGWTAM